MKSILQKRTLLITFSLFLATSVFSQLILFHPRNVTECEGIATINYSVTLNKGIIATYQWQVRPPRSILWSNIDNKNMPNASGYTSRALSIEFSKSTGGPLTTDFNGTRFRCIVTSGKTTEESNAAYLYVNSAPKIYSQPSAATKFAGESVTFSVSVTSSLAISYQWQKDGVNIAGANSSAYTIAAVHPDDAGIYRCRVSNSCGYLHSNNAELVVNVPEFGDGWVEQIAPTSQDIRKVDAVSRYIAWAVTADNDRMIKTNDGGKTWSTVQTGRTNGNWQSIEMINESTIFLGGYQVIARSTNGGSTWSFYDVYSSLGLDEYVYIYDIKFVTSTMGYAVGRGGLIIKTVDAGVTWEKQNWKNDPIQVTDVNLNGLYFLDQNNGWAVGDNGVIMKTTSGGSSWTKLPSFNTVVLNSVWFTTPLKGFATGRGSYRHLITTEDGGNTWTSLQNSLPAGYPWDIQFIDSNIGYIAGQLYNYNTTSYEGSVLKSIDGGNTWYAQKVINANQLYDLFMLNEMDGWAVGDAGEIQRTATGGCMNPSVNLYADQSFCASGAYQLVADTFENNLNCRYLWSTDQTTGKITVNSTGTYWVNVTNLCNVNASDSININVFPLPDAYAGEDAYACAGDSIQLIAEGGISYLWNNSQYLTEQDIQNPICAPPQGTTTFTVTVTDENGCTNTDDVAVTVDFPYENEKICMITIDLETGKNMVVWEKTPGVGIASYNVYRLGTGGNYNLLGNVPAEEISVFVDLSSEPEKTQYLYKISAIDTCGNESAKSNYHKTLFLQYTSSVGGVNLLWQDYQIENETVDFSDFVIFRGSDSTALAEIDIVSGTNVYTDTDPAALSQRMYYRVAGVKPLPCDPAGLLDGKKAGSGPFVHSLSNLEDNRLKTGVNSILAQNLNLRISPNPVSNNSRLLFSLKDAAEVKIELYSIVGEKIRSIAYPKLNAGEQEIEISREDFGGSTGLFYVRVWINDDYVTRKVIVK